MTWDKEHIQRLTPDQVRALTRDEVTGLTTFQTRVFFEYHRALLLVSNDEGAVNLKQKGWKLAGLTDALTEAEAVAAGFTHTACAAAGFDETTNAPSEEAPAPASVALAEAPLPGLEDVDLPEVGVVVQHLERDISGVPASAEREWACGVELCGAAFCDGK